MSFAVSDIERILGIKRDRLWDWVKRGYVKPSIQEASGTGTLNIFSKQDLVLIELFKRLTDRESTRDAAGRIIDAIRHCGKPLNDYFVYARLAIGPDASRITEYYTIGEMISYEDLGKPFGSILGDDFGFARCANDLTAPVPAADFDTIFIINMRKIIAFIDSRLG